MLSTLFSKSWIKIPAIILGLIILAAGVLYGTAYYRYLTSPEYQALKELQKLEDQYRNDPYGGETPEETFDAFIAALNAGDTALAAKYFIVDQQQEWTEGLANIKRQGNLDELIRNLEIARENKRVFAEDTVYFEYTEKVDKIDLQGQIFEVPGGEITNSIELVLVPHNRKWKITDL